MHTNFGDGVDPDVESGFGVPLDGHYQSVFRGVKVLTETTRALRQNSVCILDYLGDLLPTIPKRECCWSPKIIVLPTVTRGAHDFPRFGNDWQPVLSIRPHSRQLSRIPETAKLRTLVNWGTTMKISTWRSIAIFTVSLGLLCADAAAQCTDLDGDGYGAYGSSNCRRAGVDCDDTLPTMNPGASEDCSNGIDDNCNGLVDGADLDCFRPSSIAFADPGHLSWSDVPGAEAYVIESGEVGQDLRCLGTYIDSTAIALPDTPASGHATYYVVHGAHRDSNTGQLANAGVCGDRVFVDPRAGGAGTGMSWHDAYTSVAAALQHLTAPDKELDIFVAGELLENDYLSSEWVDRPVVIYGGFSGAERYAWERDSASRTRWNGGISVRPYNRKLILRLDGFDFATIGLDAGTSYYWPMQVVVSRCRFHSGAQLHASGYESDFSLFVSESDFFGGGVVVGSTCATSTVTVLASTFANASIDFAAGTVSYFNHSTSSLTVLGNHFDGGDRAVSFAGTLGEQMMLPLRFSGLISGNTFSGVRSPILLSGELQQQWPEDAGNRLLQLNSLVEGNSFANAGQNAVSCSLASSTRSTPSITNCTMTIADNIFAHSVDCAVRRSADDPSRGLSSSFALVGNLFFENGALYCDGAAGVIHDASALNAATGSFDNFESDPRFVDENIGNLHLEQDSPAIDRGHLGLGCWELDIDLQARGRDGNNDGICGPDVGADEY